MLLLKRIRLALWTLRANKVMIEELYNCIDYDPFKDETESIKLFSKNIYYGKNARKALEQLVKEKS